MGVFGEISDPSSILESDKLRLLRFLRLEDEKFFLTVDLDCGRPGDPERGMPLTLPLSLSLLKVRVRVGVGGAMDSGGMEEEICREI
jgi:hypothetical protein